MSNVDSSKRASQSTAITQDVRWLSLFIVLGFTRSLLQSRVVSTYISTGRIYDGRDRRIEHRCRFLWSPLSELGFLTGGGTIALTTYDTFTDSSNSSAKPVTFISSVLVL